MKYLKGCLKGNHLGNVLEVVTDRKLQVDEEGGEDPGEDPLPDGVVDYYIADVVSQMDYFPFGMVASIDDAGSSYRYSFQGQEKDDEIKGDNNSINYKYRMHDPRIGRFFAVDPLEAKYPDNSPYAFSMNIVIHMVELEGLEIMIPETYRHVDATYYDGVGFESVGNVGIFVWNCFGSALNIGIDTWNYAGELDAVYFEDGAGASGEKLLADAEKAKEGMDVLIADPSVLFTVDAMEDIVGGIIIGRVIPKTKKTGNKNTSTDVQKDVNSNTSSTQNSVDTKPGTQTSGDAGGLGGPYGSLKNSVDDAGKNTTEKHHMPANSTNDISKNKGGSIKMDKMDHRMTGSWGSSLGAKEFRAMQKVWQQAGDFQKAFDMDVIDVRSKFGNKYDQHINELIDYYKSEGKLDADYSIE